MATKREFEAKLRYFRDPPPMSMEEALLSENPVLEIGIRIKDDIGELNSAEQLFFHANYYLGDTLNGGLHQTLSNDTGALTDVVHRFAEDYCDESLSKLFSELKALFPAGVVPIDREQRNQIIEKISRELVDPLDDLTRRFYALEEVFTRGLVKLATDRSVEFCSLRKISAKAGRQG